VAPLWPLESFVAVNPFLGMTELPFAEVADRMGKVAGARLTMPRAFYRRAIEQGRIRSGDLAAALAEAPPHPQLPRDVEALEASLWAEPAAREPRAMPTVATVAAEVSGRPWQDFIIERVCDWAGAHFGAAQAAWQSPFRHLPPYQAWRREARLDRGPRLLGLRDFGRRVDALPETAPELIELSARRLGVHPGGLTLYFHRLLMAVGGWAGHARYRAFQAQLRDGSDDAPLQLLAVLLSWELILLDLDSSADDVKGPVAQAWKRARDGYAFAGSASRPDAALLVDAVLQTAFERAYQRELAGRLAASAGVAASTANPLVQAVFCIDVRSEVYRRALEDVAPSCETLGFAGFFGFPIEHLPLGARSGSDQCPALLAPGFRVRQTTGSGDADMIALRQSRMSTKAAWKAFKTHAGSCFGFVEAAGLGYAARLFSDCMGLSRPVDDPRHAGLTLGQRARLQPQLEPSLGEGQSFGMGEQERIDTAESALRGMSLTTDFARLVLLVGHGSTTVNNPHAAGLHCGACGGHAGDENARVAAAVLQDPAVRAGLGARGIHIPDDTCFVAALHDTTSDEITLFDVELLPTGHRADVERLRGWLREASARTRNERSQLLGVQAAASPDRAIPARGRDWSQVRPEWGLAGCASFIAASRSRTRGMSLQGRAFLHSYDWREDEGFAVLETVLTAPLVVASWINLQYYASTVDNRVFGAGNKTLHNVDGGVGVVEGTAGDLRPGLPVQSLHDGQRLVHEPLRLSAYVEAPRDAIDAVLERHEGLRQLVEHGWVSLFCLDDMGRVSHRSLGPGHWRVMADAGEAQPVTHISARLD
jgi:uncharacterized protein YbcC (UPF0753/DUF2309 family)